MDNSWKNNNLLKRIKEYNIDQILQKNSNDLIVPWNDEGNTRSRFLDFFPDWQSCKIYKDTTRASRYIKYRFQNKLIIKAVLKKTISATNYSQIEDYFKKDINKLNNSSHNEEFNIEIEDGSFEAFKIKSLTSLGNSYKAKFNATITYTPKNTDEISSLTLNEVERRALYSLKNLIGGSVGYSIEEILDIEESN